MSAAVNPYAAPAARVDDIAANPEAEAIRRAHITHEGSIKAVGALYYLGGLTMVIATFGMAMGGEHGGFGAAVLLAGFAALLFVSGWGVRALRRWGRVVGCVLAALGLLGFPIGTLINAYILYLFLSKKGRTIFSPEYRDVIAATPHVKQKTSIVVWIILALILAFIVISVGVMMIGGR